MATETVESVLGPEDATAAVGMPQLNFDTYPNQLFWLALALVATYLILSRVALPRIGSVLAERQGTITNDIAAAEELKLKAEKAEAEYERALAEARAEANRIAEESRKEMRKELEAAMARADEQIAKQQAESEARIAEIRATAMENVEQVAKETARALVDALGGRSEDAQVDEAVTKRLGGTA